MPATVIDSGTYTFEVDSGFDYGSFRLNDATKGVLGNTTYKLGPTTSYVDLSQYVKRLTYRRGRRRTVDQFGAATMTVIVDDQLAGGILNPLDDGSPYYDTTDDYFGLEPGRRVRLSRTVAGVPEYLFIGTIVTYDYKYQLAGNDEVSIQCADDFYLLSQAVLDAWNVTSETSGQRLTSLLDLPEVDLFDPIERSIWDTTTATTSLSVQTPWHTPTKSTKPPKAADCSCHATAFSRSPTASSHHWQAHQPTSATAAHKSPTTTYPLTSMAATSSTAPSSSA
jgi:hypothetical protein